MPEDLYAEIMSDLCADILILSVCYPNYTVPVPYTIHHTIIMTATNPSLFVHHGVYNYPKELWYIV